MTGHGRGNSRRTDTQTRFKNVGRRHAGCRRPAALFHQIRLIASAASQ